MCDWNKYFKYDDGNLYWLARDSKSWNTMNAGKIAGFIVGKYKRVKVNNVNYRLHRIIWEMHYGPIPNDMTVDHINCCSLDNRIENLQLLSRGANARRGKEINAKGFSIDRNGLFRASRTGISYETKGGAYMSYATALVSGGVS